MKKIKLILVILVGLAVVSCEKEAVEKVKVNSINLSVDKTSLEVGENIMIELEVLPAQVYDSTVIWNSSDNSIASISNGLVTGLKIGSVVISAKANDGSNVSDSISLNVIEVLKKETISAKWNVNNSSGYESFEFNESGNYIVVENTTTKSTNDQDVLFGTYEIIDGKTIVLSDFGTITISDINENSITFSIQLINNPDNEIVITASKQEEIVNSTKTELLCQSWELVSFDGEPMSIFVVIFSSAGTYLVNAAIEDEQSTSLGTWTWCNSEESKLAFTIENDLDCDGIEIIKDIQLTSDSFIGIDMENGEPMEIIMQPVSSTKSARLVNLKTGIMILGLEQ